MPKCKPDIDLGLAILSAKTPPGVTRSLEEIAAFCNCTRGGIWMLEQAALRKLKRKLYLRRDPVLMELLEVYR
jgi:hypothetical protein